MSVSTQYQVQTDHGHVTTAQNSPEGELKKQLAEAFEEKHKSELSSKVEEWEAV